MKKTICVFCGSRAGTNPEWIDLAKQLGQGIAERGWSLIYGGGNSGLMGLVADGALQGGGDVVGISPHWLAAKEPVKHELTELIHVETMGERKDLMEARSDAFVIIPGGIGTMDELFEVWTTRQLKPDHKKIILVNWHGFFDHLIMFISHSQKSGFLTESHLRKISIVDNLDEIYEALEN